MTDPNRVRIRLEIMHGDRDGEVGREEESEEESVRHDEREKKRLGSSGGELGSLKTWLAREEKK